MHLPYFHSYHLVPGACPSLVVLCVFNRLRNLLDMSSTFLKPSFTATMHGLLATCAAVHIAAIAAVLLDCSLESNIHEPGSITHLLVREQASGTVACCAALLYHLFNWSLATRSSGFSACGSAAHCLIKSAKVTCVLLYLHPNPLVQHERWIGWIKKHTMSCQSVAPCNVLRANRVLFLLAQF